MYERLLDKEQIPSLQVIRRMLGDLSYKNLLIFEEFLNENYSLVKELRFPFGNHYGWGYKYSHRKTHICYVFFERGAFSVQFRFGDDAILKINNFLPSSTDKMRYYWAERYPCGKKGGWIQYRVLNMIDLSEVMSLTKIRKTPIKSRKIFKSL